MMARRRPSLRLEDHRTPFVRWHQIQGLDMVMALLIPTCPHWLITIQLQEQWLHPTLQLPNRVDTTLHGTGKGEVGGYQTRRLAIDMHNRPLQWHLSHLKPRKRQRSPRIYD